MHALIMRLLFASKGVGGVCSGLAFASQEAFRIRRPRGLLGSVIPGARRGAHWRLAADRVASPRR